MSGTIDFFPCPQCGYLWASKEHNNEQRQTIYHCGNCGWDGDKKNYNGEYFDSGKNTKDKV